MKTHKLTDTHPDGIKWMIGKEFIFVKDILELIDEFTLNCPIQEDKDCWCKPLEELRRKIEGVDISGNEHDGCCIDCYDLNCEKGCKCPCHSDNRAFTNQGDKNDNKDI